MTICLNCSRDVGWTVSVCPACGVDVLHYAAPPKKSYCGVYFAAVLLLGVMVIAWRMNTTPSLPDNAPVQAIQRERTYSKIEVWVYAKELVSRQLKAPASAKWPDDGLFSGVNAEDFVTKIGSNSYEVAAWVDAENSFGALLRKRFECRIAIAGDTARLLSLDWLD